MRNFEQQISDRVRTFIDQITELARQQALETLSAALQTGGRSATGRERARQRGNGRRAVSLAIGGRGRRSVDQIDTACEALLAEISSQPGQRIEQIADTLSARTKDLALPIRKLIKQRQVRTEGQRRATRYFPAGGGTGVRRGGRARKAAASS